MGIIISSFPGCGKEYLINTHGSKAKIMNAITLMEKDEDDGYDYNSLTDKIMDVVEEYDIVFIPVAEELLDVFNDRKIDYDLFYPSKERRKEFLENMVRKRARRDTIMLLDREFDKIIDRLDAIESENCYKHKLEEAGQFIGNQPIIMSYIDSLKND
jgi:hypothetical protein